MSKIETGVDKLVELISTHKKIPVSDAAKKLGVSNVVVQEWADFLEEEGLISIEYKFNKTVLTERQLSKTEIKEKAEEFLNEKDAFTRKVETSLKSLEKESSGLTNIKDEFNKLKSEIGEEIGKVKDEVTELEKFENLKKNLDKDIIQQQKEYHKVLDQSHSQLKAEEARYQELLEKISVEKRGYEIKTKRLHSLEEKEEQLSKKIENIYSLAKAVQNRIYTEEREIGKDEKSILALQKVAKDIEKNILEKKSSIQPLLDKVKDHEDEITSLEDDILKKVKKKTAVIKSKIKEGEQATTKFETFFKKKKQIESLIAAIDRDKAELREELGHLAKKATSFDLVTKSTNVKVHISELQKELNQAEKKKLKLKTQLKSLMQFIKG